MILMIYDDCAFECFLESFFNHPFLQPSKPGQFDLRSLISIHVEISTTITAVQDQMLVLAIVAIVYFFLH